MRDKRFGGYRISLLMLKKKRVEASLRVSMGVYYEASGHQESGKVTQFKEACFGSSVSCY